MLLTSFIKQKETFNIWDFHKNLQLTFSATYFPQSSRFLLSQKAHFPLRTNKMLSIYASNFRTLPNSKVLKNLISDYRRIVNTSPPFLFSGRFRVEVFLVYLSSFSHSVAHAILFLQYLMLPINTIVTLSVLLILQNLQ